ncbi:MAG: DUF4160 domain-containing protein [Chloroflexi bacterium]|nr:DUF4160 domain-containing protein [Chloroflexota bacterium]
MPTVAEEGPYQFRINTRELPFEPPHVHVWASTESLCRIELNGGGFMDEPPPGAQRAILAAYRKHAAIMREMWDRLHQR